MNETKNALGLTSALSLQLISFLDHKRAAGRVYGCGKTFACDLDHLLTQRGDEAITPQTAHAWLAEARRHGPAAASHRATFLRQFCGYLGVFGEAHYQPPSRYVPRRPRPKHPHVFTKDELIVLLDAARKVKTEIEGSHHLWLLLLYTCGLRPSEARNLDISDVDLHAGVLRIRETKFKKSRYVPVSTGGLDVLRSYDERRREAGHTAMSNGYFLIFTPYRHDSQVQYQAFRKIVALAGIEPHPGCNAPRPYDLRHTFAVHRLLSWYEQGDDVMGKLHRLATFMGHVDPVSTEYYLHITGEILGEANRRFHRQCGNLLGVSHE